MKILVVSGFLGAGKTTFIEHITKKIDKKFAILENEYGEVGIDGDLLKKDYEKIWEMTEGCICCSMKSNFANSIMTISNSIDVDVLIVEPTGVGMLSSVMNNIKKVEYDRIEILEPITIVDPNCIDRYSQEYSEIFVDQIKNSRFVVLSKTSDKSEEDVLLAVNKIKNINPDACVYAKEYDDFSDDWWEDILNKNWNFENLKGGSSSQNNIENIGFKNVCFQDMMTFNSYMSAIMSKRFGSVIRAKGFLPIDGKWVKMDIVGDRYSLVEIEPMKESKLIFIGSNLNKEDLKILFNDKKQKRKKGIQTGRSIKNR